MREILFRGKTEDGQWVFGDLFHDKDCFGNITNSWIYEYDKNHGRQFQSEVIPETVGQYTGLDDKNGVKIFEGDILHDSGHMLNGVVEYYAECGGWWYWDRNRFGTSLEFDDFDELTVIGNIHDNPQLMEGTE